MKHRFSPIESYAGIAFFLACMFFALPSHGQEGTSGEIAKIDSDINESVATLSNTLAELAERPEKISTRSGSVGAETIQAALHKSQDRLRELTTILSNRQKQISGTATLSSADRRELLAAIEDQLEEANRVSVRADSVLRKIDELPAKEKSWSEQYSTFLAVKGADAAKSKVAASILEFRQGLPKQQSQVIAENRSAQPEAPGQERARSAEPSEPPVAIKVDRSGERYPQTIDASLRMEDVESLNAAELRYAINEMFARHGLVFRDKQIQRHFRRMKWYSPQASLTPAQVEERFTPLEKSNLEVLANARERLTAGQSGGKPPTPQREFSNPIAYFSACQEHVDANWKSPSMRFPPGHSAIALVKATIGSDGRLMSTQWIQRSGYKEWDQAVLNCLQRIPPFPAPPAWLGHRPAVQLVFPET